MEIKILDINTETLESKLAALGANKVFDDFRTITYFKNPKDDGVPFLKLTEEGEKLKLSSQDLENHEDVKVFVSRKNECVRLLATLGYVPVSEVKARRISCELGSIDFDIDQFPGIPAFLEIDMGENPLMTSEELSSKLGLENNKKGQYSTPEIVEMYGKDYFEIYRL